MRTGIGYDIHRLVSGRKLVLGGVTIPFEKGLEGHSDADVLLHAICDALLGAAGQGDIGQHFPDDDPAYDGINSALLLERTCNLLRQHHFEIINIDCTILAQAPKLAPYGEAIRRRIARIVDLAPECINIKATTTERLGVIGRHEAMAAMSVATIKANPASQLSTS
jgi:2-C-methyl-D-erythritol 2,4-cyclodiphosphate synthase